jgi:predicted deacylase
MKRAVVVGLACMLAMSGASAALAQEEDTTPEPVVRMGDWVEIGDDLFVNFIIRHYPK